MISLYLFLVLYQFSSLYVLENFLSVTFGYMHISYNPERGAIYFWVCVITPLAILPAGTRLQTASQFMFPVLIALIMSITPLFLVGEVKGWTFWAMYGCIFASMAMLALASRLEFKGLVHPVSEKQYKLRAWILAIFFIMTLAGGATQNFHFVSFAEIYSIRGSDAYSELGFIIRVVCMYVFSLGGLFVGLGLLRKSKMLVSVAMFGFIFCYGVSQYKSAIMAPAWLIYIYLAGRYFCKDSTLKYYFALTLPFFAGALLLVLFPDARSFKANFIVFAYLTYVNFRFYGTSNEAVGLYHDFFTHHQVTHWSHITGVDFFLHYPYGSRQIAEVLENQYKIGNFNASFLATDTVAAYGYEVMPLVTLAMALFYVLMNSVSRGIDKRAILVMMIMPALMFNERAFATSLLTGGIIFFMFYLSWIPKSWRDNAPPAE